MPIINTLINERFVTMTGANTNQEYDFYNIKVVHWKDGNAKHSDTSTRF